MNFSFSMLKFFDIFSKTSVRVFFLEWGTLIKWYYFKQMKGFFIIIDITMTQKKKGKVFFLVKFYLKILHTGDKESLDQCG